MTQQSTDLSWLPSDAEEQLALAFRIISNAYKTRVQSLEAENKVLRHQLEEKQTQLLGVQKKLSNCEVSCIEGHHRQTQLSEENKNLISAVKKLQKDIQRLESLKQAVLNSIHDGDREEDTSGKLYLSGDYFQTAAPITMQEISGDSPGSDAFSRFTRGNQDFQMQNQSSPGSVGVVDGKHFFKTARSRLTYEQFNRFLNEIKKLNAHQQTRDETLDHSLEIFGDNHHELYEEFKQLLNKHSTS